MCYVKSNDTRRQLRAAEFQKEHIPKISVKTYVFALWNRVISLSASVHTESLTFIREIHNSSELDFSQFSSVFPEIPRSSRHSCVFAGRIRPIEKCNDLIGNRTRDLPPCSLVPQPTTLLCAVYFSNLRAVFSDFFNRENLKNAKLSNTDLVCISVTDRASVITE
jgi:hypothetical protein